MDTRKLSFRLLSALTCAVAILLLVVACAKDEYDYDCANLDLTEHDMSRVWAANYYWLSHYPNVAHVSVEQLWDRDGNPLPTWGIRMYFLEELGPQTLASIPRCLEGVPIQVQVQGEFPYQAARPPMLHSCAEPWWEETWEGPREGLIHTVEVTPQVVAFGETVTIKQTFENISGRQVSFVTASPDPYGFMVTRPNGDYVFDSFCHSITNAILGTHNQGPDEVWERTYKWDQWDMVGQQIPPGTYLVRGMLTVVTGWDEGDKMWMTEPVEVEVLPTYHQCEGPDLTWEYVNGVRLANFPLLWHYPNVRAVYVETLPGKDDHIPPIRVIHVSVSEEVDPETLPPEDRIPSCLEGVPVRIEVGYWDNSGE